MANKFSDAQKELMEDLYIAGADKGFITIVDKGKAFLNKINTLVQKAILSVEIGDDVKLKYKLTPLGITEAHRAFNISRS